MAEIEKNAVYMEGFWAAERIIPTIEKTTFKSIKGAIVNKTALTSKFESEFGFSRDMDMPDGNYAFNLGMLDAFTKAHSSEEEE